MNCAIGTIRLLGALCLTASGQRIAPYCQVLRGLIIISPIGRFHMGNPGQKGFPVRALLAFVRPDDAA